MDGSKLKKLKLLQNNYRGGSTMEFSKIKLIKNIFLSSKGKEDFFRKLNSF